MTDLLVIGSGFGSLFFLHEALRALPERARVVVLEWGENRSHAWQLANRRNSDIDAASTFTSRGEPKDWRFTIGVGGGTNCWWGVAPRAHPSEFRLHSRFGVGRDWPIDYGTLEPFYAEAERLMLIAGDDAIAGHFPRSTPFPLPPHRLSTFDERMRAAMPDHHFAIPSARASVQTATRGRCCGNATCNLCPSNAKFTAENGLGSVFADPRVELVTGARVLALETAAGSITGARYRSREGMEVVERADVVVLGANAIFSPAILLASDIRSPATGRHLHESVGLEVEVFLDGIDHFDGGTATTGVNYALFDGEHRRSMSGATLHVRNWWYHGLRTEEGRWRQTVPLLVMAEDIPDPASGVVAVGEDGRPIVHHAGPSPYALDGLARAFDALPTLLRSLPVERLVRHGVRQTEAHLQGTLRMGTDPSDSVVDGDQRHHTYRNLVAVGTSVFPSCTVANPSLTAAALSLRAARRFYARGA